MPYLLMIDNSMIINIFVNLYLERLFITIPNLSLFKTSPLILSPNKCSMALSSKKCENKYNGLETNANPFQMIALTTSPALILSLYRFLGGF